IANNIIVPPYAIGGEQRHVRNATYAVIRNVDDAGLPGGLGVSLATATNNARDGGASGRTPARAPAAAGVVQKATWSCNVSWIVVAKAGRAIGGSEAASRRDELASARVVPRDFGNVRLRRAKSRRVAGIPIGAGSARKVVAEIGATDRDIVGGRSEAVDANAMRRNRGTYIATGSVFVARRHEDRDALGDG